MAFENFEIDPIGGKDLHLAALEIQERYPGTDYVTALKSAQWGITNPNDPIGSSRRTGSYDPARLAQHDTALAYANRHGVNYLTALHALKINV